MTLLPCPISLDTISCHRGPPPSGSPERLDEDHSQASPEDDADPQSASPPRIQNEEEEREKMSAEDYASMVSRTLLSFGRATIWSLRPPLLSRALHQ